MRVETLYRQVELRGLLELLYLRDGRLSESGRSGTRWWPMAKRAENLRMIVPAEKGEQASRMQ